MVQLANIKECHPKYMYLGVSSIEQNGTYFRINMYSMGCFQSPSDALPWLPRTFQQ